MAKNKYIIYTSSFDEKSGGVIALHLLCHLLNEKGEDAYVWPMEWVAPGKNILRNIKAFLLSFMKFLPKKHGYFAVHSGFNTPIAKYADFKKAIAVYPEVVSGNPLGSESVVRWFLNKPGFLTSEVTYGNRELYFFYNIQFNDKTFNVDENRLLKTIYVMNDVYKRSNFESREGTCYILRKGMNRHLVHDVESSILIDGLSHQDTADIFNKVKYCISYDTQTMLSKYAAMCGCISIVIPEEGVTMEQWRPKVRDRYGVAYGFDDLEWALSTMDNVLIDFNEQIDMTNDQVNRFIQKCEEFFSE